MPWWNREKRTMYIHTSAGKCAALRNRRTCKNIFPYLMKNSGVSTARNGEEYHE